MGNTNAKLLTPEALKKAESDLLEHSGLNAEQYEIRQVIVDEKNQHYVTTTIVGDETKATMVLVHGYGGSGTLFCKVMKGLSVNFRVIVFDVIGMGSSSRPKWDK